ncbi:MAG: STAS-like domain-containing protein [Burkholderiales bacterium]
MHKLSPLASKTLTFPITPDFSVEAVWSESILPLLKGINDNVIELLHYGFAQLAGNVVAHSASPDVVVEILYTTAKIRISINDSGVGVLSKLAGRLGMCDARHAAVELVRGKVQKNPQDGVAVTARMFDEFTLRSGNLMLSRVGANDWLLASHEASSPGTFIVMANHPRSPRTVQEVFEQGAQLPTIRANLLVKQAAAGDHAEAPQYEHSRAGGKLSKSTGETLESADEAKQLLEPYTGFNEIFLDFAGVKEIAAEFADEAFKGFRARNPGIKLMWGNANVEVEETIQGVAESAA